MVKEIEAGMPRGVVITHDGKLLFVYASNESTLEVARQVLESVFRNHAINAAVLTSHWDDELDDWRQTAPPEVCRQETGEDAASCDAAVVETRTLIATCGKLVRAEFEQTMLGWADKLGIECKIVEHPRLLTTEVGFVVTGLKHKVEKFSHELSAEGRATIRIETAVTRYGSR